MRNVIDVTYFWDLTWVTDVLDDTPHHLTQVRKPVSTLLQDRTHLPIPVESTWEISNAPSDGVDAGWPLVTVLRRHRCQIRVRAS